MRTSKADLRRPPLVWAEAAFWRNGYGTIFSPTLRKTAPDSDKARINFMSQSNSSYQVSHWIVRVIVLVNFGHFVLTEISRSYYLAFGRSLNRIIIGWLGLSTVVLVLYVVVEAFWMSNSPQERKAILIDAAFVAVWFVFFWAAVLYTTVTSIWL